MIPNRKRFFGVLLIAIGLVLCCVGSWMLLSPPQYRASVTMKLDPNITDVNELYSQTHEPVKLDPYLIQTEFEVLQSEIVLGKVVETLNLKTEWGKNLAGGGSLKTSEAIALLKQRMDVHSIKNTKLIEVGFTSEDPVGAAKIANAIAVAYQDNRRSQWRESTLGSIEDMEERYKEGEQKVKALQEKVEKLKNELKVPEDQTNDLGQAEYRPYWEAKRELESAKRFLQILSLKIESEKVDIQLPKRAMMTIVDRAAPPLSPVGPNRRLGAAALILGLAMIGVGLKWIVRPV